MSTEMTESVETDDFLKITIKEEPLEDVEGVNESIPCEIEIKDEPKDINESNDSTVAIPHSDHTYIQVSPNINSLNNTPSPIHTSTNEKNNCSPVGVKDAPVTRKIMINGQEKTCVLVKMPQSGANSLEKLEENAAKTPNDVNSKDCNLKVQCPRCKSTVELKTFRQHIDACPPKNIRKPEGKNSDDPVVDKTSDDSSLNVPRTCDIVVPKDKITSDRNDTVHMVHNLAAGQLKTVSDCTSSRKSLDAYESSASISGNENESCSSTGRESVRKLRRKLYAKDLDLSCLDKSGQNILKPTSIKEAILTHIGKNGPSCSESAGESRESVLDAQEVANGLRPRSKSLSLPAYTSRISAPESGKKNCLENNERNVLLRTMANSFSQKVCETVIKNTKSDLSAENVISSKETFSTRRIRTRSYSRAVSEKCNLDSTDPEHLIESILETEQSASKLIRPRSRSCSKRISASKSDKSISVENTEQNVSLGANEKSFLQTVNDSSVENTTSDVAAESVDDNEEIFPLRRMRTRSCSRMMNGKSLQSEKTNICTDDKSLSRRTRSKSCSRVLNKDASTSVDRSSVRIRSKSVQREKTDTGGTWNNLDGAEIRNKNGLNSENQEKICHASQMAYYQKFLEVRSRSVSNKINLSDQSVNNKINDSKVVDRLGNTKEDSESDSVHIDVRTDKVGESDTLDNSLLLEDNTLSCSVCSFTTDKQKTLKEHERNHRRFARPVFKCIYCNQKYTRYALYLHVQTVHPGQKFDFIEHTNAVETGIEPETIFKCKECPFSAKTQILLTEHIEKHVGKSGIGHLEKRQAPLNTKTYEQNCGKSSEGRNFPLYKCPICSYTSHIRNRMDVHEQSHKRNLPIKPCPNNCSFRSTREPLRAHLKNCVANNANKDDATKKESYEETNIKSISIKTKSKRFHCPQCEFSSKLRIKMNFHIKKEHSKDNKPSDQKIGAIKCPYCSFTSNYIQNLRQHVRCHESNMPILKCDYCDYRSTLSALKKHFRQLNHWPKDQEVSKSDQVKNCSPFGLYTAKNTQDTSTTESPIKTGVESVPPEKPLESFPCKLCSFVCADLNLFKNHMMTHDQNPPNNNGNCEKTFSCQKCSYVCSRKNQLKVHMKTHKRKEPIEKCQYCDFRSTPRSLLSHIRGHNIGDKSDGSPNNKVSKQAPFSQTSMENNLVKLQAPRIEKVPKTLFKCPYCLFSTDLRIKLKIHSKKHDNSLSKSATSYEEENIDAVSQKATIKRSLLRCSKCSFTTNMKSNLEMHIRQQHPSDFQCKICSVITRTEYHLQKHLQSHKNYAVVGKCPHCNFRATKKCLFRHIRKHKNLKLAKEKIQIIYVKPKPVNANVKVKPRQPYQDQSIEKDFGLQRNYKDSSDVVFKCPQCSFSTNFHVRLKIHLKEHKTQSKSSSKRNQLIADCSYGSYSTSETNVLRHITREHKISQFDDKKVGIINTKAKLQNAVANGRLHNTDFKEKSGYGKAVINEKEATPYFNLRCNMCSFVTMQKETFREHATTHKQNQPIEKCKHCSFNSTPRDLLEHAKVHNVKAKFKLYKCKLCSADGLRPPQFNRHMDTHAKGQPIKQCTQCEFKSTASQLRKHVTKMEHYNNFESAERDNSKTETSELNESTKKDTIAYGEIGPSIDKVKNSFRFQCDICSFSTSLRIKLNVHRGKMHPELYKVPNGTENDSNTQPEFKNGRISLESSKLSKHDLLPDTVKYSKTTKQKPIYKCTLCAYTSSYVYNLKHHMSSHKVYNLAIGQCSICDFKGTASMMATHKKSCYAQDDSSPRKVRKILMCDMCSFATHSPSDLEIHHANIHKNTVKTFKCRYCSFTSYWEYLVDRHMHSHTILKMPIKQCTKCDFKSTPSALAAHVNKCIKR